MAGTFMEYPQGGSTERQGAQVNLTGSDLTLIKDTSGLTETEIRLFSDPGFNLRVNEAINRILDSTDTIGGFMVVENTKTGAEIVGPNRYSRSGDPINPDEDYEVDGIANMGDSVRISMIIHFNPLHEMGFRPSQLRDYLTRLNARKFFNQDGVFDAFTTVDSSDGIFYIKPTKVKAGIPFSLGYVSISGLPSTHDWEILLKPDTRYMGETTRIFSLEEQIDLLERSGFQIGKAEFPIVSRPDGILQIDLSKRK
ncbi:MAG: hypothetical protein WCO33_04595 [bacterium]